MCKMKASRPDVSSYVRGLLWAAPVLAAWQGGCILDPDGNLKSSCSGFRPQPAEERVPFDSTGGGEPPSTPEQCMSFCAEHVFQPDGCHTETGDGGPVIVVCSYSTTCVGRRPAGALPPAVDERAPLLGRYFAAMAAAEAASVVAFEQLAEELETHGLCAELVARSRRAAADEARHYRMAAVLARKFGATARRESARKPSAGNLLELAVANVREGLVVETLGAAIGWWQAAHAGERSVRRMMERIAADETEHAVLSWDLDAAMRSRLSASQRAQLDAATAQALVSFEEELETSPPAELVERAGLPSRQVAAAMLAEARKALYS
jgi:hypothetical protein